MTELVFRIPSAPSTNGLYANVAGKGRVKSQRYRVWANAAGWAMKLDGDKPRTWNTITGPVSVEIISGGRKDVDNNKAVLDLLTDMAVIGDDSQVIDLRIRKAALSRETVVTVKDLSASGREAGGASAPSYACAEDQRAPLVRPQHTKGQTT